MERLEEIEAAGSLIPILSPAGGMDLIGVATMANPAAEFASPTIGNNIEERAVLHPESATPVDAVFAEIAAFDDEASGRRQPADENRPSPGVGPQGNVSDTGSGTRLVQTDPTADPLLNPPSLPRHGPHGFGMPGNSGNPPNLAGAFSGGGLPGGSSTGGGGGGGGGNSSGGGGGGSNNLLNQLGVRGDFGPAAGSISQAAPPPQASNPPIGSIPETAKPPHGGNSHPLTGNPPPPAGPTYVYFDTTQTNYSPSETAGTDTIYVDLNHSSAQTVTVNYATSAGTAKAGEDYNDTSGTLTFTPGETQQSFNVTILDDNLINEASPVTVTLTLSAAQNATINGTNPETLNIGEDTGDLPTVQFSAATYNANETDGSAAITATLSQASTQTVTVTYATQAGTAVPNVDYYDTTNTLTFTPGTTQASFNVTILDDNAYNETSPETVDLSLTSPNNATLGSQNTATLNINENDSDPEPTVQFSAATYNANETDGTATITATLSNPSAQTISVPYQTLTTGTAIAGQDYDSTSGTLTFNPYATQATFTVNVLDDNGVGENSPVTVNLQLNTPTGGATLGAQNTATLNINEDDDLIVQFSSSTYNANETDGTATITVTLNAAVNQPTTVYYSTISGGTAIAGTDYTPITNAQLTIPAGQTSGTFNVTILDDKIVGEASPVTVDLQLSNPQGIGAMLGSNSAATLNINEDSDPTVEFSSATYSATEPSTATITVNLSNASTQTVTVNYATSPDTAKAGTDYTSVSGTLTFDPGITSQTFNVTIKDDNTSSETSPETVNLTLSAPTGDATLGSLSAATLNIGEDNDPLPTVQLSASSYSVTESAGKAAITVKLSNPSAVPVTVYYTTADGTAVGGKDYTVTQGTLTIKALTTSATINVPIVDDNAVNEPSVETFTFSISNPSYATLGATTSATISIKEDSDGGSNLPNANAAMSQCNCGCLNSPGSLVSMAYGRTGPQTNTSSTAPVRYADGVVTIAETDLHSEGFGFDWGQTRAWTNGPGYDDGSDNGAGWVDTYIPHMVQADGSTDDTLVLLANGTDAYYYDLVGGAYQPRYDDGSKLTYNSTNDTYTLIDTAGDQSVFSGFGTSWQTAQKGQFQSFTSPGGTTMSVTSYTSDGHVAEMQRQATVNGTTTIESWQYSYLPTGNANAGLLSGVVLRTQINSGPWNVVRQVQYAYYDGTQTYGGSLGDLMTATVEDAANNVLAESYYRYYTSGQANGYTHALHYVFNPQSYARLTAALGNNLGSLTDGQVANYADNAFQYDSSQRVAQEVVQGDGGDTTGGLGTYSFSYTTSSNVAGFNSWHTKTVVTNPDGSTDTVYTNFLAEVMLVDHYDPSSKLDFDEFYSYNNQAQLTLDAAPSAVTGYNDSNANLGVALNNNSGFITLYDYYTSTSATETMAGGVVNYLQDDKIEQGQQGTPILQETWQYYAHAFNGQTIAPLATDTVYRNTDGSGAETTTSTYTWYTNSAQIQSETDSAPVISAAENGPGTADVTTTYYDVFGNAQWIKDPDGYIQYFTYDTATGAQTEEIDDVNTADTGEFVNLPSGWTTPTGGGLNLITQDVVDALGRTTEEISPSGDITYYVYLDPQHEERIYNGWNSTTNMPTGPTDVYREDWINNYVEELTMTATPHLTNGAPDGTELIGGLQTLSRQYMNYAGQEVNDYDYYNLSGLSYSTGVMGTTANYYLSAYGYDAWGRQDETITTNGTIYQTNYDSLDRAVSDWVGTSAGMTEVSSYVYDGGGVGDGNLTQETDYPGLGQVNRVTNNYYDWRDRLVATKSGVESNENDGTNRPIIAYTYDNLDETTETQQYTGDGVTPQIVNGVLQALPAANLRAQEIDSYDDQGRLYQSQVYDVNPTTGAVSQYALTTNDYYDHRGDLIAESDPGGLWYKSVYDGVGRDTMDYTTDGAGGTTWADAGSVANDTVLEQTQTVYDADSNVIETIYSQRFHNATGTGPLGSPTSGIGARVYYAASYYDNADRVTADVDVGTNGGTAWTRPSSAPTPSNTVLVTSYAYNAAGWVQDVTDPMGIDNRTLYDNLGRVTETIQDYTGGTPGNENDVATQYGYDGNDNVTYVQADEPGGAYQQTAYVYNATTTGGDGLNSYDILTAIEHPDPTSGNPSATQKDSYVVDALGEVTQSTDRDGNVHQYAYDVLGRITSDAVTTLGAGVDGSIRRIQYAYDSQGNNNLITSYNAASGGSIVNQVQRVYNGLGQLTGEYQSHSGAVVGGTPEVQYAYTEMSGGQNNSRLVSMTYPDGYTLDYNYNTGLDSNISRLSSISDSIGTVEAYKYLGLDTVVERDHPNGNNNLPYIEQGNDPNANHDGGDQYTGLDRFGRVIDQNWVNATTGATLDRYQYGYDADSDVLYRQNLADAAFSELYTYDNLNQLTSMERGTLNSTHNGIVGSPSHSQSWSPDALGNFNSVTTDGSTQTRTANQQNEITSISGQSAPTYDANGNLLSDGAGNTYVYDAWNRLVSVSNNGTVVATYSYDGLGRRIEETHSGLTTDLYLSSEDQVLEEYQGGKMTAYNVWSPVYVNALIFREIGNGYTYSRYYVLQDANWNVTALTDTSAGVLERYVYDAYGAITVLAPDWSYRGASNWKLPNMAQGMLYDWAVNLYHTWGRDISPTMMRPLQTDPWGLGPDNNDYRWEANGPTDAVDPTGLERLPLDRKKTVVIISNDTTEGDSEACRKILGNSADIYSHIGSLQEMIDSLKDCRDKSIHRLILGGHSRATGCGVSVLSPDAQSISYRTIIGDKARLIRSKLRKGATVEILSCGSGADKRKMQFLANNLQAKIIANTNCVNGWTRKDTNGAWVEVSPNGPPNDVFDGLGKNKESKKEKK